MLIKEINHHPEEGIKSATVELSYDELRDISNALYECSKTHNKYHATRTRMFYLFEIVKNGNLDHWAIEKLYEMTHPEIVDWAFEKLYEMAPSGEEK